MQNPFDDLLLLCQTTADINRLSEVVASNVLEAEIPAPYLIASRPLLGRTKHLDLHVSTVKCPRGSCS